MLTTLLTPDAWGFFSHQAIFCDTSWVSYNLTQFLYYSPGVSNRSHKLRAHYHETAPTQLPTASRSPGYQQLPANLATVQRFPWPPPPWIRLFARKAHRIQVNTCLHLPVYCIIRDNVKDTDEHPDEEIHRARFGRVPNTGASVPVELGSVTFPVRGCVHQCRSFTNPILLGF